MNPFGCVNLPNVDESILVLREKGPPPIYRNVTVTQVAGCRFTVVHGGQPLTYRTLPTFFVHCCVVFCIFCITNIKKCNHRILHDRKAKQWDMDFAQEQKYDDDTSNPPSGNYTGWTSESDGTKQHIAVTLEFENGCIAGRGRGSRDGHYRCKGISTSGLVTWTETYFDTGKPFTVKVRGVYREKTLDCFFLSLTGVTGEFTLRLNHPRNMDNLHRCTTKF